CFVALSEAVIGQDKSGVEPQSPTEGSYRGLVVSFLQVKGSQKIVGGRETRVDLDGTLQRCDSPLPFAPHVMYKPKAKVIDRFFRVKGGRAPQAQRIAKNGERRVRLSRA